MNTLVKECPAVKAAQKKQPNSLVKLLQRIKPIATRASIRYDTSAGHWAVLDKANKAVQHFDTAIMENATFRSCKVERYVGCSGSTTEHIGIADGELYLHRHAGQLADAQNLHFRDGKFLDSNGHELLSVNKLAVLPTRRAVYWT